VFPDNPEPGVALRKGVNRKAARQSGSAAAARHDDK
jgi:hypothetical protein